MEEATIRQLSAKMASGEITAVALAEYYLSRIESLDRSGPALNSVIEVNPDALAVAAERDRERAKGKVRGPLHGIPILLKDNIDTHDQMQTTAGSLALEGSRARRDAFLAKRLRAAGAVFLGKTNMSEWAGFRSNLAASGWSSRGGLTRNPYALDRTCCGSSSGSGAAVAASLCAAAIGTETDGSIICPATMCGIVGLKPTLGLISRSGIIPIAHSQDTAGPMTRTVDDAAVLLGCLAGVDPDDPATRPGRRRSLRNYTTCLDPDGLKGARLGVARNMLGSNPRIIQIVEAAIDLMRQMGAVIVDPADLPNWNKFTRTEMEVLSFEFKADLNRYLGALGPRAGVHSLEDVIRFNEEHRDRVMPYFGQDLMTGAQAKGPLSSPAYRRALARNRRLTRQEGIDALIAKKRLDAIVTASGGPAWTVDLANGDPGGWDLLASTPAAVAGYPHITVPAGFVFGLPIGISFFSTAWREPTLLKIAYAFEQALGARRPPEFKPRADL